MATVPELRWDAWRISRRGSLGAISGGQQGAGQVNGAEDGIPKSSRRPIQVRSESASGRVKAGDRPHMISHRIHRGSMVGTYDPGGPQPVANTPHFEAVALPVGFEPVTHALEEAHGDAPLSSDLKLVTVLEPFCRPLPPSWSNGTKTPRYFERDSACASARNSRVTASTAGRRYAAHRCWRLRNPNRAAIATIGWPSQ